jgi:hypothetical protein
MIANAFESVSSVARKVVRTVVSPAGSNEVVFGSDDSIKWHWRRPTLCN